ncbi:CoA transferase [Ramlibacter sp. G-1-2-2]|uniref:CoA transferase n=1 Tax=Ramlibacter agri TaxID=2728837 RepID=A0A848H7F9_9BURK|nr:CoA transferase [Ramlibacter agri]NML46444.1 CoA transferase [Ramlibacter agri]
MQNILAGVRVLELGQVLAGPFAGAIFADLGAEVVKLERPAGGDDARHMGPAFRHGDALNFHIFNRGKKSVAIDLKSPEGLADFERLAADSDILVHNLRAGVPESLGIDGPSLCARHPRLIYCGISAFGHAGPMAQRPGYEPLVQAFSGLSSLNGGPDDPPMRSGASLCDQGTGMWAVIAALALLERRHRTGRGGVVQASLLETALVWNGQKADAFVNQGRLPDRHRSGHPGFVPYEAFDTADLPVLICCGNDRLFAKLAQELGRPGWVEDPRFATNRSRLQNKAELLAQLEPLLREQPRATWLERFEAAGVPCAPVHTVPEALAHPQVQALGLLQPVPDEDFSLTALPITVDGERPTHQGPAPRLGQHNPDYGLKNHG